MDVPPGQSVALLSQPPEVAVELLDMVAGLRRPGKPGSVVVGGLALEKLNSQALDRYRASRGLLSPRFPLLASRSVTGNVLAALPSARIDPRTRGRAAELLALTLLVVTERAATAIRCQRMVTLSGWRVTDDEPAGGDDPWTRGRIDRIG